MTKQFVRVPGIIVTYVYEVVTNPKRIRHAFLDILPGNTPTPSPEPKMLLVWYNAAGRAEAAWALKEYVRSPHEAFTHYSRPDLRDD